MQNKANWFVFLEALSDGYVKSIIKNELGGWPLLDNEENNLSSLELLKKITKYGVASVFNLIVGVDPKNTRVRRIKVKYFKTNLM